MRTIIDFVDGNTVWREAGNLVTTNKGFTLHSDDGGSRVFPLSHRRAEVYVGDDEHAIIVEHNGSGSGELAKRLERRA